MAVPRRGAEARLDVLDFLLGQSRTPASIDKLIAAGQSYDLFAEFNLDRMSVAEFRALWDAHLPALAAEAARRGIPLPDPTTYQPVPMGCWVTGQIDE